MVEREVTVGGKFGLHARVALEIVERVSGAPPGNGVELIEGQNEADAFSVMSLMTLGASTGKVVRIRAIGKDAERLVGEIEEILKDTDQVTGDLSFD